MPRELRIANRSRSGFPDRSAADLRASLLDLNAIVASAQTWHSAVCWMSAACSVSRFERKAVGADGEQYAWTKIVVTEVRDGLVASICEFDLEDEEAAFAIRRGAGAGRRHYLDNPAVVPLSDLSIDSFERGVITVSRA